MEVIVNGSSVDLGDSIPTITKQSVDIYNPSIRFIDFTNKFKLPDTITNRAIFGSPAMVSSNNRGLDKLYDVVIRDISIIFRGKGFLEYTTKNEYSLQVIDNSKELFKAIDVTLRQISWDDKDTQLTTANIDSLDTEDLSNCWYWGKACLHSDALQVNTDQTTGDARCKYSRPSFSVNALLKRAIENQGYTYTEADKSLAFSGFHNDFFFTSYQKTLATTYNPSGSLALSGLDTNDFVHGDLTITSTTINIGTNKVKFRLRGEYESSSNIYFIVRGIDNVDSSKITESKVLLKPSLSYIDFETSDFQSDDGVTIDIRFEGTGSVDFTDCLLYNLISDTTVDLSTNPFLDYKIKAYDNLPDVRYIDLFRLICVIYNKYQIVDSYNKTFEFATLANLNKLNAVDWSDKFVIDSDTINSNYSGIARKNNLKYTNDETINLDLGSDYFITDNEYVKAENDYITIDFGASNEVVIDSNTVVHIPIYNDTTRIGDLDVFIRLFEINSDKLIFNTISWDYLNENYYKNIFNSLYRIRNIKCKFNLNKYDVISWKENKLVYIDYYKSTFIILEISNFIAGKLTTVSMLNYGRS